MNNNHNKMSGNHVIMRLQEHLANAKENLTNYFPTFLLDSQPNIDEPRGRKKKNLKTKIKTERTVPLTNKFRI